MLLCNNILSQNNSLISSQPATNYKNYPLTKLIFEDGSYKCGHYDSSNNVLFNCWGVTIYQTKKIREMISDTMCCKLQDLDGDGVNDGEDRCVNEKGPASNFGCPVIDESRGGCYLNLGYVIFFKNGGFKLSRESVQRLQKVIKILKDDPKLCVGLDGHTDDVGDSSFNMKLSISRIEVVKSHLILAGINKARILYATPRGSKYPIADNSTETGRGGNRRVEISMNYKDYLY